MDKSQYLSAREYEMMTILLPDQGEDETQAAIQTVLGYITDEQGTVNSIAADSPWGRRRLAYTIRHEGVDYRDGHYVLTYFTAMPAAISEIERELKLDTNVIRYLLLIHDPEMGEKIDESQIEVAKTDEVEASEAAAETAQDVSSEAEKPADGESAEKSGDAVTETPEEPVAHPDDAASEESAGMETEPAEEPLADTAEAASKETVDADTEPAEEPLADTAETASKETVDANTEPAEEPTAAEAENEPAAKGAASEETATDDDVEKAAEE